MEHTIQAVMGVFGAEVSYVYRHLPLPQHASAYPAAVFAECAGEQGRLAEMHGIMFAHDSLRGRRAEQAASRADLPDVAAFLKSVGGGEYHPRVENDIELAVSLGVRTTPTVIVNGAGFERTPDSLRLHSTIARELVRFYP